MSGAFDVNGKAWLWGFGTNSQLGKGNDDGDEEVCTPRLTLVTLSSQSALKGKALHLSPQPVEVKEMPCHEV